MLQDVILMLLIIVVVPLCSIVVLRGIAKTKRQRRPVQYFRIKSSLGEVWREFAYLTLTRSSIPLPGAARRSRVWL